MPASSELLELKQVLSALLGAVLTLLGQGLWRRFSRARTAKALAVAFWEELSAVNFHGPDDAANFAGFSGQTFDVMFRDMAESMPESLGRELMRYHWRMKYLEAMKPYVGLAQGGGLHPQLWREAMDMNARLKARLDHLSHRWTLSLLFRMCETCDRDLLEAGPPAHAD